MEKRVGLYLKVTGGVLSKKKQNKKQKKMKKRKSKKLETNPNFKE